METEAKFLVSDEKVFHKLENIDNIASFDVVDKKKTVFRDTYLDTVDMVIYSSGYSFRCREKKGKVVYTLKSLKSTDPLIHKREELELVLPEKQDVVNWENGRLKDLIMDLAGSGNQFPLFYVYHKRTTGHLVSDGRVVAELSLDDVVINCEDNSRSYLEVELELEKDGSENELREIIPFMEKELSLIPGSSSKFDNGFDLLLENIRASAERIGYPSISEDPDVKPLPLRELFEEYDIEREHARKVTENSLELFDRLSFLHGLDPDLRHTMKIAALVHDIGVMTDVRRHHKVGRDILMLHPPAELPLPVSMILPWTTFLHKKKIDPEKIDKLKSKKAFSGISDEMEDILLKIASILRLADGLDYSRMNSKIYSINPEADAITVEVEGPGAQIDADRANTKADLWHLLFEKDIIFRPKA